MNRIYWDKDANPISADLVQVLYQLRAEDKDNPLLLDSITVADIMEDAEEELALDALVTPYSKLERRMTIMQNVMNRAGSEVKVTALQVTSPFKNRGITNVAAIFELSDGQTISVFFHNPDTTPNRLAPTDEMVSWKWLLNKKDVTIVVAPEHGKDLNVHEVARRLMRLADKNSAAFARANKRRSERLQALQVAKDEVTQLESDLSRTQKDIEAARIDLEDKLAARDAAKAGYEARKAEREAAEAERKAKEEAERRAAEERARQEEEKRKADEEAAKRAAEEADQPKSPHEAAETAASRLSDANGTEQANGPIHDRLVNAADDIVDIVRMYANAGNPKHASIVNAINQKVKAKGSRAWWDPMLKRVAIGLDTDGNVLYINCGGKTGEIYLGALDTLYPADGDKIVFPAKYAVKIANAINPKGFPGALDAPEGDDVPVSENPILKGGENVVQEKPAAPKDETTPNDLDVETDKKVIQSIIDKTHPKIQSSDLFNDIAALWNRYDGKNDEIMEMLNRAVEAWSEVANELTKGVA